MFAKIANIFKVPDLKSKILFTGFILIIYRLGSFIPVPGIDSGILKQIFNTGGSKDTLFGLYDLFVGGNFSRASIFALGIMPYITSSIVVQLLGGIFPYFEKLKKEGAEGQRKMNQIIRYLTVGIGSLNAIGISAYLQTMQQGDLSAVAHPGISFYISTVVTLVAGTILIMWLGEQITENGIGNGISLIIFAGIIARYPAGFMDMFVSVQKGIMSIFDAFFVVAMMVFVTAAVIFVTEANRKIPVQYAKRIVGRKIYGGQSSFIPLKVNTAGVIPIIFAQSLIMFPRTIVSMTPLRDTSFGSGLLELLSPGAWLYTIIYMTLIVFFAYFYTAMVLNPVEMADNMKKNGGYIPGKKPGKKTAEYINSILTKITLPGALFFAVIAVMPEFMQKWFHLPFYFGGTGIIIIVGVALDTLQQIESHLVMRHYDGFMKKGKLRGRRN